MPEALFVIVWMFFTLVVLVIAIEPIRTFFVCFFQNIKLNLKNKHLKRIQENSNLRRENERLNAQIKEKSNER